MSKKALSFSYFIKSPGYIYILIFLFPSLLIGSITIFLPDPTIPDPIAGNNLVLDFLITIIVAPLIETLLFQSLIIELVCKLFKRPRRNLYISVTASSVAFALSHSYSICYIIITFLAGIILALAYYLGRYRKESPIVLVFVIHAVYNLLTLVYNTIIF